MYHKVHIYSSSMSGKSPNNVHTKLWMRILNSFSPGTNFKGTNGFSSYMNTYVLTWGSNLKDHCKKIMYLLLTVVLCLLKVVEHGIEQDVDSAYGVSIF